jgi:hypothetical protein
MSEVIDLSKICWGSVVIGPDGKVIGWRPNERLQMSAEEQFHSNLMRGVFDCPPFHKLGIGRQEAAT